MELQHVSIIAKLDFESTPLLIRWPSSI